MLLLLVGVLGCAARSEAQRCRVGAAFQTDPALRELQMQRCEQIALREELQAARQDEQHRYQSEVAARNERDAAALRQARRQRELAERQADVRAEEARADEVAERKSAEAAVRRNPQAPEIGATPKEAEAVCARQGGRVKVKFVPGEGLSFAGAACFVGRARATAWQLDPTTGTVNAVVAYYEGSLPRELTRAAEKKFGPAHSVNVEHGFRVWNWNLGTRAVQISSNEAGAWMRILERTGGEDAGVE